MAERTFGQKPATGAEALLMAMRANGIRYLFANAGTDFPAIIEAFATLPESLVPRPVTVPHETAGMGMAHGYWLATGQPQSVMVHVNVGLANAAMGVLNAASDDVPVLVMSGRTPLTETGRPGHRRMHIHYGQEMFDQTGIIREAVRFSYELRYPDQAPDLVARALAIAQSAPGGPVYLSLPREPLTARIPRDALPPRTPVQPAAMPAAPDPEAVARLSSWLAEARAPLVICQRGDPAGRLGHALAEFATRHGVAVGTPFATRNVMASDHPNFVGFRPGAGLAEADLVIVLDSAVPWIPSHGGPRQEARIVHVGPDPHFSRLPVRGHRADLAIRSDPLLALLALDRVLGTPLPGAAARNAALAQQSAVRRERLAGIAQAAAVTDPMGGEWLSRCIGEILGEDGIAFSDLGIVPAFMDIPGPNRVFNSPHAGGLGWAMNAALGAQLADRERLVVACVGDGSYIFANPVSAHQIAAALDLPILTVVKNNRMWNAVRRAVIDGFPEGAAVRANEMPLTSLEPVPDFVRVAEASGAHAERVSHAADLPAALARAVDIIRTEGRQALLDVRVAPSDDY